MIASLAISIAILATVFGVPLDVSIVRITGAGVTVSSSAVTILSSGNIVISGHTAGNLAAPRVGSYDGFIRNFATNGTVLWTNQVPASSNFGFVDSDTDLSDNIYAIGQCAGTFYGSTGVGDMDVCFIKYDPAGNKLVSFRTGSSGDEYVYGIAVNKVDGAIYIAGFTRSDAVWNDIAAIGITDAFLLKYSISGTTITLVGFYRFGTVDREVAFYSVAVDSGGNVWAAGYTSATTYQGQTNNGVTDFLIQKMSPTGAVLFARLVGGTYIEQASDLALDAADNAYVIGNIQSNFDGIPFSGSFDFAVVKYNSVGVKQWSRVFGGTGDDKGFGITVDKINNVILVTGITYSRTFYGVTNPLPSGSGSSFVLVLSPSNGSVLFVRLYAGAAYSSGAGIATNGAYIYVAGDTNGATGASFQGQTLSSSNCVYMMRLEGYGGAPSAIPTTQPTIMPSAIPTGAPSPVPSCAPTTNPSTIPSVTPSAVPTIKPTEIPSAVPSVAPSVSLTLEPTVVPSVTPSFTQTAIPTASPTRVCVQWALGDYGETCSATCGKLARVCKNSYFNSVVTQEAFYDVVASSVNVRSGALVGLADQFCSQGTTSGLSVGVPVAFSFVQSTASSSPVRTTCSFPTSAASSTCDSAVSVRSVRRFCPCVDHDCDGGWFLGYTGDSCDATCANVGGVCEAAPLANIADDVSFSTMVASATALDTDQVIGQSAADFCTEGINLIAFASAPAAIKLIGGPTNQTLCTYPTPTNPLDGACDKSFQTLPAQRFCNCKLSSGARRLSNAVTQDTGQTVTVPATRTPKLRGYSF